jgi:superfamily I DNA and/or RNA helicase
MRREGQAGLLPLLLSLVDVVGATCIGIDSKPQFREVPFDVVIIDESGQIQLHNLMVPLSRAPKAILVGDHLQLPPVVDDALQSHVEERGGSTDFLMRSWFEKLWGEAPSSRKLMLDTQFRCPPVISNYISAQFYDSAYYAGKGMSDKRPLLALAKSCLLFIDTSSHRARFETSRRSEGRTEVLDNELETDLVLSVLERAVAEQPELALDPEGIGVIVPYKNHVERIRAAVHKRVREGALPRALGNRAADLVASVDSFQGQERQLIIFTLTRSNRKGEIGFLAEARRLNVAMTRAKRQLVMIGDLDTLGHAPGKPHEADFRAKMRALEDYVIRLGHPMTADEWYALMRTTPVPRGPQPLEGE